MDEPVAVIQARMGSTRLGGKVLKKVLGKPLLQLMIERLKFSKYIKRVIVATTTEKNDDVIAEFLKGIGIEFFRGSNEDVLDRYYQTAKHFKIKLIAKFTADCPLIDPRVADRVIEFYLRNKGRYDYVSNMHPPTYPDGLDIEVFPFATIERAWKGAKTPHEREHVTPYIWDNPKMFRIGNVRQKEEMHLRERWCIDYNEDYLFIKKIFENLYEKGKVFYMGDILAFLKKTPAVREINKKYVGENWWSKEWKKLKTKKSLRTRLDKP